MVYDSVMTESREVDNESMSTDEFLGCDIVIVENLEEYVLSDDPVGDIEVNDSDEFELILGFKRTKPTMKPAELHRTRRVKSTTSPNLALTVPLP